MEEKLLKIFKLADLLNSKQNKVYAQVKYSANDIQSLEIAIRSKEDFSFVEKCEIYLVMDSISKLDQVIKLFNVYIKGVTNE